MTEGPLDPGGAGVIKVGASYQRISRSEARRLEAAAIASNRTGAAILVHTEVGTCGHEIVDRYARAVTGEVVAVDAGWSVSEPRPADAGD